MTAWLNMWGISPDWRNRWFLFDWTEWCLSMLEGRHHAGVAETAVAAETAAAAAETASGTAAAEVTTMATDDDPLALTSKNRLLSASIVLVERARGMPRG